MTLYFVHIPKTAGTSFRTGFEDWLNDSSRIAYDYGPASGVTSELVQRYVHERDDLWAFHKACRRTEIAMIGGHLSVAKYLPGLNVRDVVSFVREPLQRMISEYMHFVRHNGFIGTFRDFYLRPAFHNRQWKLLQGAPRSAIGFIGVTEQYEHSLAIVNRQKNMQIPLLRTNAAPDSASMDYDVPAQQMAEFRQLNQKDFELYNWCCRTIAARWHLLRTGAHHAHAQVNEATTRHVKGWAWWESGDDPVAIAISVNGIRRGTAIAKEYRADLCRLAPPRGSFVGFDYPVKANRGDRLECRVELTSQLLLDVELSD